MNKRIIALATGILIAIMVFSTAFAGGGVKISGTSFTIGSLIANGNVSGIGNTDVTVKLVASGKAAITCTNNGSNDVPGQSSPKVSGMATDALPGSDPARKNGKAPFTDEAFAPGTVSWDVGGCPNSNWTATVTAVYWDKANISVYQGTDPNALGSLLASQNYDCITTLTSVGSPVSCTAAP